MHSGGAGSSQARLDDMMDLLLRDGAADRLLEAALKRPRNVELLNDAMAMQCYKRRRTGQASADTADAMTAEDSDSARLWRTEIEEAGVSTRGLRHIQQKHVTVCKLSVVPLGLLRRIKCRSTDGELSSVNRWNVRW